MCVGEEFIMNQKWFMAQWSLPSYINARISLIISILIMNFIIKSDKSPWRNGSVQGLQPRGPGFAPAPGKKNNWLKIMLANTR